MSADPGSIRADGHQALPNLAVQDASADPHIITAAARTGTDIELRIHTSIAPFDVAAEQWFPAAAGFAVTVIVHTVDVETGVPRHLPPAESAEWARAIFSTVDSRTGTSSAPSTQAPASIDADSSYTASTSTPTAGRFLFLGRWSPVRITCYRPSTAEPRSPFHDGLTRQAGRLPDHGLRALLPRVSDLHALRRVRP
ncbi:hypothetical protein GCM10028895_55510 [Pontibacter rugosus]